MVKRYPSNNESGMALVIALVIMTVLTLIGLAATFTSTFEIMLSGEKRRSTDAFYNAESGANVIVTRYLNFIPGVSDYDPFTDPANLNPTNVVARINYDPLKIGPPEGESFGRDYAYFWVRSTGNDQTGAVTRSTCTVELNVYRVIVSPDSITEVVVN